MTVVLDSWAALALLKGEPSGVRVQGAVLAGDGTMCSVNVGEVLYTEARRVGVERATRAVDALRRSVRLVEPDWPLVKGAALIKASHPLAYADAFCIATARLLRSPLWTGDPEILALEGPDLEVVDLR